jgi:glycogen synthase
VYTCVRATVVWCPVQAVEAKALNKEALQAEVGLPVDRNIPLVAFIGRLEEQKGPDVMAAAIPQLMEMVEDVQIVLLVRVRRPPPGYYMRVSFVLLEHACEQRDG